MCLAREKESGEKYRAVPFPLCQYDDSAHGPLELQWSMLRGKKLLIAENQVAKGRKLRSDPLAQ